MREKAYIGIAWQMLVIYMNMKFAQPLSQLIYHLLDMTGDKLIVCYKKAFMNLIQQLKTNWLPKYEAYTDDVQNGMYTEPMNKV